MLQLWAAFTAQPCRETLVSEIDSVTGRKAELAAGLDEQVAMTSPHQERPEHLLCMWSGRFQNSLMASNSIFPVYEMPQSRTTRCSGMSYSHTCHVSKESRCVSWRSTSQHRLRRGKRFFFSSRDWIFPLQIQTATIMLWQGLFANNMNDCTLFVWAVHPQPPQQSETWCSVWIVYCQTCL